jgi:hypothetical protein
MKLEGPSIQYSKVDENLQENHHGVEVFWPFLVLVWDSMLHTNAILAIRTKQAL